MQSDFGRCLRLRSAAKASRRRPGTCCCVYKGRGGLVGRQPIAQAEPERCQYQPRFRLLCCPSTGQDKAHLYQVPAQASEPSPSISISISIGIGIGIGTRGSMIPPELPRHVSMTNIGESISPNYPSAPCLPSRERPHGPPRPPLESKNDNERPGQNDGGNGKGKQLGQEDNQATGQRRRRRGR